MESSNRKNDQIAEIEGEIRALQQRLEEKRRLLQTLQNPQCPPEGEVESLTKEDVLRYSRQMIVRAIGVNGQKKLKKGSVLIIGCGGLGCPAAQYLAGSGIGRLGLVDYDVVEESNLHRQLLHSELTIGMPKVTSLAQALHRINSKLHIDEYKLQLDSTNALDILSKYDVVVDASDNVATRYLVNDACVLTERPLVSGSAVGLEAQLTVYNYKGGPCYRCLFICPPPPETVSNCSDVGVVGPVPGAIGVLQALQSIHILTGEGNVLSQRLLLFDGEDMVFRTIKLRGKSDGCAICGSNPSITKLIDYEQFCGAPANDKDKNISVIDEHERITPNELHSIISQKSSYLLVDVRSKIEFEMCNISGSLNIPLKELAKQETQNELIEKCRHIEENNHSSLQTVIICRRGNDSQLGVKIAKKFLPCPVFDVVGGLHGWSRDVDPSFPKY